MIIYRDLKEGVFVLTDQEERIVQGADKLNFKGWLTSLESTADVYLDRLSLIRGIQGERAAQSAKGSIKDSHYRDLKVYSPNKVDLFSISPEQIGLKWTFFTQDSQAVQMEKQAFLSGPKVVCWAPNLKAAAALSLEGWQISEERWTMVPEVYKDQKGDSSKDKLSASEFYLRWSEHAWVRLGGHCEEGPYPVINLYHLPCVSLIEAQYHFASGETKANSKRSDSTIKVTLRDCVRKPFKYARPTQSTAPNPSSKTMGVVGPRPGDLKDDKAFYLNYMYFSKHPQLFQQIFEEQAPSRLITGLSEGWDFLVTLEALSRQIPVTIVWTDNVCLEWEAELIKLKDSIFSECEVIDLTNLNTYFGNIKGYFNSVNYEQARLIELKERNMLIAELSDVIISGYPFTPEVKYHSLDYAHHLGKPIYHY